MRASRSSYTPTSRAEIAIAPEICHNPGWRIGQVREALRGFSKHLIFFRSLPMLLQIFLALALAGVTVTVHALGSIRIVMPLTGLWTRWEADPAAARPVLILTRLVGGLLLLHLAEAGIWAAALQAIGVTPTFESSLSYSLESYTTVGYGNLVPHDSWRLVGPIEAAVGILMFGWSTGIVVTAVQRIYNHR